MLLPANSFGLGLRVEHYAALAETDLVSKPDWLEIISENFMVPGGKPLWHLDRLRRDYPVVMHGVSMSIGSADPLDLGYLRELRALADRIEPAWISDHLCWTGVDHRNLHDLLPLALNRATLEHLLPRIAQVQELLGRRLVLENVSSYLQFEADAQGEAQFIAELARRSGCGLLLDVNNVYVSSRNHGFDAQAYIDTIPAESVVQIHLAGHEDQGGLVIDTHDHPICNAVWQLYAYTLRRMGPRPSMIERDDHMPPLPELLAELDQARALAAATLAQALVPA
ncbi:DUF692 domain-containing protein [Roseateles microcysteis]|uniref:MNIO family bufferin maturase n=1 Tax=Roseateles microcysteis TaxID=3119057 RepID=UPI002FE52D96